MLAFYTDHNVPRAIVEGLRRRGIDVITAHEDSMSRAPDADLLGRATELERVLFTQDQDLLAIAARWQADGVHFFGIVFLAQEDTVVGRCVQELELVAAAVPASELANSVLYLPL